MYSDISPSPMVSARRISGELICLNLHRFSPHKVGVRNSPFFLVSDMPNTLIIPTVV